MDPKIWGPFLWYILHIMSFNYPVNPSYADKRIYHDFYVNLKELIPCANCRKHYQQHLHTNPITPALDTRADLVKWVIDLHNLVNISIARPVYTYSEVINAYKMNNFMPPNYVKPNNGVSNNDINQSKSKGKLYFWILLFGGIVGYRLYRNYQRNNAYYY